MKALFITRHYLDEMLGGPNCSKAFLRALADIYPDLTVIYPEHNDRKTDLSFMRGNSTVTLVPVDDNRSKLHKCWDMYWGRIHRFMPFVEIYLKGRKFDVIFIDHSFTAAAGLLQAAVANGAHIVTFHHNVESQYLKDNKASILYRLPHDHFALKAEKAALNCSYLNLTLTDEDQKTFSALYPSISQSLRTIGVFEYEDAKSQELSAAEDLSFVISGSMSAMQTETAMLTFLDEYMPAFNEECPDAKLIITGRNPSKHIYDSAARYNNVSIIPNPQNLVAQVAKANYYICPIYTGGGLKLRCLDALRAGLPVLAHKVSARGYEGIAKDGFLFEYSDKQSFKAGLHSLTKLHNCHKDVLESFISNFSFEAGKKRLAEILQSAKLL